MAETRHARHCRTRGLNELGTCAKWHLVPWRISRIIPLTVVHKQTCWLCGHHSAAALICLIWAAANDSLLDCFLPLKSPRPSPLRLITSTSRHVRKTAEGSTCSFSLNIVSEEESLSLLWTEAYVTHTKPIDMSSSKMLSLSGRVLIVKDKRFIFRTKQKYCA